MGNTPGGPSTSICELSGSDHLSAREASSSWFRSGVPITDVYDVVDVLGAGNMGEVFTVRRKTTGHHTELTRDALVEHEREWEERARREADRAARPRRSAVRGAARKAKEELRRVSRRGGTDGGRAAALLGEDANSDLAPFIAATTGDGPPARQPSRGDADLAPPKSIMRAGSRYGASPSASSSVHSDQRSAGSPGDTRQAARRSSAPSKGVHFQRTFAVKTILTSRVHKNQMRELVNEIEIMRKLDHPNVLKLYEVYQVKRKLWLVTELLRGGDLASRQLDEGDARRVLEQVLRALVYLHRNNVVHRDVKLENVLYEDDDRLAVRLIDFGLSQTFDRAEAAADYTRTQYTLSPERARSEETFTDKTDVWALGVTAFVLLSGHFPFVKTAADLRDPRKMENLEQAKLLFGYRWRLRGISEQAKDFVKGCLQRDPIQRWTARQALENLQQSWAPAMDEQAKTQEDTKPEHESLQHVRSEEDHEGDDTSPPPVSDLVAHRKYNIKKHVQKVVREKRAEGPLDDTVQIDPDVVERYTKFGLMKKTILMTMANTMDRRDVIKLRELFLAADTNVTGTITREELVASFRRVSPDMDEERALALFSGMDRDRSGHIHYAEFLAALAESHGLVTLERLGEAFDRLDTDGKGFITSEDLKSIFGKDYDKDTVDKMIEEGDFKKNNKIDYEELLQLMFSDPAEGDALAGSISHRAPVADD